MKEQAKWMHLAYANRDPSLVDKEKRVKHHSKKQELSMLIDKAFKEHFHKMVKKSQKKIANRNSIRLNPFAPQLNPLAQAVIQIILNTAFEKLAKIKEITR